jgi:hypothetical protein
MKNLLLLVFLLVASTGWGAKNPNVFFIAIDELAAKQFAPRITEAGRHWSVRFDKEIESNIGKQVMGMVITIDAKGNEVRGNRCLGFNPDKNVERPRMQINLPVRAVPSKPLVLRQKKSSFQV